jgi:hypothetical protein
MHVYHVEPPVKDTIITFGEDEKMCGPVVHESYNTGYKGQALILKFVSSDVCYRVAQCEGVQFESRFMLHQLERGLMNPTVYGCAQRVLCVRE